MVVIKGKVAVMVTKDFPCAWFYYGAWYVWERDFFRNGGALWKKF